MSSNPNIDPNEINQFSEHAASWWDPTGPYKALHAIHPVRMAFIQQIAQLQGMQCIDIGCGGGLVAESMVRAGAVVDAIDMDPHAINIAKTHAAANELTINYQLNTAEQHANLFPEKYDVVTCLEMLEHVPEPASILQATQKLCKPNGLIVFSTINRSPTAYLGAIIGAEYLLNIVPRGTHQYQRFIKPSELANWARQENLNLIQQNGIRYNPFTQASQLIEKTPINYIAAYRKS